MDPKSLSDLTRGDLSQAAATSGRASTPAVEGIDTASPGARASLVSIDMGSPGEYVLEGAGDRLVLLNGSNTYIVEPIEEPASAYAVYKLSPHLSPILSAICANVYSAQAGFDSYIDMSREDSRELVEQALLYEKALESGDFDTETQVAKRDIDKAHRRLLRRQANERQFLETWIARCCPGSTYRALRTLVGLDMEIMGSGYIEVLRNTAGRPHHLLWAPAWSVRARPVDQTLIPVREAVPVSRLSWGFEWQLRRFRSYIQIDSNGNSVGVYKEYGDPRVLSRKTGLYYSSLEQMHESPEEYYTSEDGQERVPAQPATELLSFQLQTPVNTTYGKPDWTGVFPTLLGSRELEEENRTILTDQKVPQMLILIAGGAGIDDKTIQALQDKILQNRAEGKKSIYFLQARSARSTSGGHSPNPDIEVIKTKSEQHADALGIEYQKSGAKLCRIAYRMPKSELGDSDGLGKDQQLFGHRFAEAQVYDPRRDIFDDRFTTTILKDLGIQTLRQRLRPRPPKEPGERAEIVARLTSAGILTPDDGRVEAREILDRDYKDLLGVWSKLPKELLTSILQTKNQLVAAALLDSDEREGFLAKLTEALREQLGNTKPTRPGQIPVPLAGEILGNDRGPDKKDSEPPA